MTVVAVCWQQRSADDLQASSNSMHKPACMQAITLKSWLSNMHRQTSSVHM
jgi:hypothetical protein